MDNKGYEGLATRQNQNFSWVINEHDYADCVLINVFSNKFIMIIGNKWFMWVDCRDKGDKLGEIYLYE